MKPWFARIYIAAAILGLISFSANAGTNTLRLVAEDWCPHICESASKPGYMIEIARAAFEAKGYKVEYILMPLNRAVKAIEHGRYDGIAAANISKATNLVLPKESQGFAIFKFFVKEESNWVYKNNSSLEKVTLGLVEGVNYRTLKNYTDKYKADPTRLQYLTSENPVEKNIRKLLAGRITAMLDDKFAVDYHKSRSQFQGKIKETGKALANQNLYIAFNAKDPRSTEYAEILSAAMPKLRKSGKLKEILGKYNISDWKGMYD